MDIISRQDAIKQGLITYFTGKPCKHGHIEKRSTKTGVCRGCNKEASKNWYHKNNKDIEWKKKRILKNVKNRTKKSGIAFNITVDDIDWPTYCPVLGFKLDYSGKDRWRQVSLDKTDPSKGYVVGNVVVMSMRANAIKYDATVEELEKVVSYLKSL